MSKKIAVINDLSGFGRCSLTAAISAISVMGVQPCPLPTAILSAQTGYPSYYCDDYTDKMEYFREEWEKMGARFDGIYTGFLASEAQVEHIFRFLDTFYKKDTFLLVDPVMGDEGRVYAMFTEGLLKQMKELAVRADIITPNLTELCLLTDYSFDAIQNMNDTKQMMAEIKRMAEEMIWRGPKTVVVTGIRFIDEKDQKKKIGNLVVTEQESQLSAFPYIGGSFSGTGDLFASVIAGGTARGDDIFRIIHLAGEFIEQAMKDSVMDQVEANDGVNYEKYLKMLVV